MALLLFQIASVKIDIDNQKLLGTGKYEIVMLDCLKTYNEDSRHNWYLTRPEVYEVKINENSC